MDKEALKIPKKLKHVKIWVHPEGPVVGGIYLYCQSDRHEGEEQPVEAMNSPEPFFVLRGGNDDDLRFYNKNAVVRLEYSADPGEERPAGCVELGTRLHLMDGSTLEGVIREMLVPEHARLFDYVNIFEDRFVRLFMEDRLVTLVNKAYIVRVTPLDH
ncbi:hypothetical protein B1C78_14155 [Thioalkalivibrio denitrificans]|uniref:Uncharacterized protein n=1 Tax=Thioalkalivibrio denitrificans TaxID=108003 RepID=A0A1V3NCJ4_9GAMM|nr:hypothetical protein [Thioalkalivibrio denitrificans]OOG22744.1 hypothetical protein B1C78_14155 [Thioalkalivibrio denitrificans]